MASLLLEHSTAPQSWPQALSYLREELRINLGSAAAKYEISEVKFRHDQLSPATNTFRQALRLNPGFASARIALAQVLRMQGKTREALVSAQKLESANPSLHFLLGQLYWALGDKAAAEKEQVIFKRLQSSSTEARQQPHCGRR